jgi:hypothetical protein
MLFSSSNKVALQTSFSITSQITLLILFELSIRSKCLNRQRKVCSCSVPSTLKYNLVFFFDFVTL